MFFETLGWLAIPVGLMGMAMATKSRWGFGMMLIANLLWLPISVHEQYYCMATSCGMYSLLTFRNALIRGSLSRSIDSHGADALSG